jgi:hypothetical protein
MVWLRDALRGIRALDQLPSRPFWLRSMANFQAS